MLGDGQQIEISYDLTTGKVSEIYVTCKEETFEALLIDVLPYLVPETYLTKEEIKGMFEAMRSDEFKTDSRHPKFALSGSKSYLNTEMVNVRLNAGIL